MLFDLLSPLFQCIFDISYKLYLTKIGLYMHNCMLSSYKKSEQNVPHSIIDYSEPINPDYCDDNEPEEYKIKIYIVPFL